MACVGNSSEFCGGPNALNVYNYTGTSGTTPPPPPPPPTGPIVPPSVGDWVSLGCYKLRNSLLRSTRFTNFTACFSDSVVARVLANGVNVVGQVSIETCTAACFNAGYPLAGAEYAGQCCKFHADLSILSRSGLCGTKQTVTISSKTTAPQSRPATVTWPVSGTAQNFVAVRTR